MFLGFGVAVVERDFEDYSFTHGYQSNEMIRGFTDSTLFNLGPASKLFTAISIVKLADEGLINLEDPVYAYFPEFLKIQGKKRRHSPNVRIIDLLQHHSGLTQSMEHLYPEKFDKGVLASEDDFYQNTYNYRAFLTLEDFKERFLFYATMDKKPQKKYNYSNLNFVILGYILENVTGLNTAQFVTNKIFVPLGMEDSHYYLTPDSQATRLSRGYYKLGDGSYLNVHENEVESPSPTGDGGVKTSLRDMRKFMHFLVGDLDKTNHTKVLQRATLLSMIGPQVKGPDRDTWVGLGFHNLQPFNFSGHAGGWDGFLSILYYHPESHSCLFLVTNREDNELFLLLRTYAAYAMLHRKF